MSDTAIRITAMNKFYGTFHALKDVDLEVARGERIVICGPSGSGKSMLIRCINRLEEHQSGTIEVMGTMLDDNVDHIDEIRREAGMVASPATWEGPVKDKLYINREWVAPVSGAMFVIDPWNREVFHRVPRGGAADIDVAVRAARAAFDQGPWPRMSGAERATVLRRIGDAIATRMDELARMEVRDNGKPLPEAVWDIEDTAGCFHFYADLAERLDNDPEREIGLPLETFYLEGRDGAGGRGGGDHPLELSDADGSVEGRAGSRRGLHDGAEALRAHADYRAGIRRDRR